jgi:hypothetical protein
MEKDPSEKKQQNGKLKGSSEYSKNQKRASIKKIPKNQPKSKPKIKQPDHSDLRWAIPLFLVIVIAGLSLLYLFGFPVIKIQAADIIEKSKPEEILSQSISTSDFFPSPIELQTATPFELPTTTSTFTPKPLPTEYPTFTPIPPSNLVAEKSFISYAAHSWDVPGRLSESTDFWIEVDLSHQMLFAYEGNNLLNSFSVSSGTSDFPTVTGSYKIYTKYPTYTMVGPGYNLPNVPYSMFFYKGYSIHGTYWHHNFGTPMSHGCVNMETSAAAWVYAHAKIGTNVFIHY